MAQYGKATRRKLRELVSEAYERELGKQLDKLATKFEEWKKGEIVSCELSHFIHKFHNGSSREIYNIYQHLAEDDLVARAIILKYLIEDEVPNDILELIKPRFDFYKQQREND